MFLGLYYRGVFLVQCFCERMIIAHNKSLLWKIAVECYFYCIFYLVYSNIVCIFAVR